MEDGLCLKKGKTEGAVAEAATGVWKGGWEQKAGYKTVGRDAGKGEMKGGQKRQGLWEMQSDDGVSEQNAWNAWNRG